MYLLETAERRACDRDDPLRRDRIAEGLDDAVAHDVHGDAAFAGSSYRCVRRELFGDEQFLDRGVPLECVGYRPSPFQQECAFLSPVNAPEETSRPLDPRVAETR